tara:strand:- start:2089 stop:2691 length:603 start_codon:yes stop_codon:yes gene_type:complete
MEIVMDANDTEKAKKVTEESLELAILAQEILIQNPGQYAEAGGILKEITGRAKAVEEARTAITKPLLAAKREVDKLFKPPADSLNRAKNSIKRSMLNYSKRAEQEKQELERKARELAASNEATVEEVHEVLVRATTQTVTPKVSGVIVKKVTKFEIEDESKLPRHVLKPDQALIRADVRAGIAVPGVRVWQEDELSSRGQ